MSKQKKLGQFFTPAVIVDFMCDLVGFDPFWKVMDPACGDGSFLLGALKRGAPLVAGIDIDPEAIALAEENLSAYRGKFRLFLQDGLQPIQAENALWKGHYDLVIGNPPFSSSQYRVRDKSVLERFSLAKYEDQNRTKLLWGEELRPVKTRVSQIIEVLFLERFIQLARPGGKIAIILPEGVFANSGLRHVREYLVENLTIHAIIGLPRQVFKDTGTTAKTAILFLEKRKPSSTHKVLLGEVEAVSSAGEDGSQLEMVVQTLKAPVL